METNIKPKVHFHLISAVLISILVLSGCSLFPSPEKPAIPPSPDKESPILIGTESSSWEDSEFIHEENYTPIGFDLSDSLDIYLNPVENASIIATIPASALNIKIFGEPILKENTAWILAEYNLSRGWVRFDDLAIHVGELPADLITLGQQVVIMLQTYDYIQLADLIHPDKCLLFSPYPNINDNSLVFCPGELGNLVSSEETYTWGRFDGTGNPIVMDFPTYHQEFIYDADYFRPELIGFNIEVSSGNAINNIIDIYPNGVMIEYYFSGFDSQYGGMDWRSLRLVFIQDNQTWFLVAIIHGEWTI
jgi:hypothetical protein